VIQIENDAIGKLDHEELIDTINLDVDTLEEESVSFIHSKQQLIDYFYEPFFLKKRMKKIAK